MNQRILELARTAKFTDQNIEDMSPGFEKFAELIIQECASRVRDTDLEDVEGGDSAVLNAAAKQLKQHFGVKE